MFKDGIIHVKLRGCASAQMFMTRLSMSIQAAVKNMKQNITQNENYFNELSMKKHHSTVLKTQISDSLQILKEKKILLILDNCEDPIDNDHKRFVLELENILENYPKVKLLVTSRKPLKELIYNEEKVFILQPLSNK